MPPPNINDLVLPASLTDAERLCIAGDVIITGFLSGNDPKVALPFALRQLQLVRSDNTEWVASFLAIQMAYAVKELDHVARAEGASLQLSALARIEAMVSNPHLYLTGTSMRAGFSLPTDGA